MPSYKIHRLKDHLRQYFRHAPHVSGAASVKPRDYTPGETVEARTPYAAYFDLRGTDSPLEPGDLLGVYDRVLRDPGQRVQYHYVLIDFLCRRVGGELGAGSDAAEVRWFTQEELPALNLAEDTFDVIRKGFAKLKARL